MIAAVIITEGKNVYNVVINDWQQNKTQNVQERKEILTIIARHKITMIHKDYGMIEYADFMINNL